MSSLLRALPLMCLVVTSLLACKPDEEEQQPPSPIAVEDAAERFARQACKSQFACECASSSNFASEDDCVAQMTEHYQLEIDERLDQGASWNADCAGQLLAAWSQWQCLGPNGAVAQAPYDPRLCPLIKGTAEPGSDCVSYDLGDSCVEGSTCLASVCVSSEVPVARGEVCAYDWQELPCEAESYCGVDPSGSGERICKALPSAGDICTIDEGWYCGPGSLGLMCNYETERCEPAPAIGEPCFQGSLCGPNAYCDGGKDFTCQERFELGDSCGADAVCPVDASCVSSVCIADPAAACNLASFDF